MFVFASHQVNLLVKFLNPVVPGPNFALELLNFVIKHEFELLKLLDLLSKVLNDYPLVGKSHISVLYLLRIN